jgi:primosomal protein N''
MDDIRVASNSQEYPSHEKFQRALYAFHEDSVRLAACFDTALAGIESIGRTTNRQQQYQQAAAIAAAWVKANPL